MQQSIFLAKALGFARSHPFARKEAKERSKKTAVYEIFKLA
jgi:hypothetical protein